MLVLNRHFGESIIIEGGISVTVLSAKDRTVWLKVEGDVLYPPLFLGALGTSPTSMRLSIGSPLSMLVAEAGIRVALASGDHPSRPSQTLVSFECRTGDEVFVDNGIVLGVKATEHEHPNLILSGESLGEAVALAFIKPFGNWVRLGVDAPGRRVYRKELWEELTASNVAAVTSDDDLSDLLPKEASGARI